MARGRIGACGPVRSEGIALLFVGLPRRPSSSSSSQAPSFRSGIFLLLGIAALVWLAMRATDYGQEIGKDTYRISARFSHVADLRVKAPVKLGGVTVGMVVSFVLDPVMFEAVVNMHTSMRLK